MTLHHDVQPILEAGQGETYPDIWHNIIHSGCTNLVNVSFIKTTFGKDLQLTLGGMQGVWYFRKAIIKDIYGDIVHISLPY